MKYDNMTTQLPLKLLATKWAGVCVSGICRRVVLRIFPRTAPTVQGITGSASLLASPPPEGPDRMSLG